MSHNEWCETFVFATVYEATRCATAVAALDYVVVIVNADSSTTAVLTDVSTAFAGTCDVSQRVM